VKLLRGGCPLGTNGSSDQAELREWWWVVECSDYIRKQYPGTPRYAVVAASRLDEYRNIIYKVRYSSESDANAASIAAEGGTESLSACEVVCWPPSFTSAHPETSRYEAVSQNDIHRFWKLGAKTVQSGLSHADAVREASRRCALPDRWCVVPNDSEQTKRQEPYTVKLADFLSFSEKDSVLTTCDSEQEAWQAIPKIRAEAEQRLAQFNREEIERRKNERAGTSLARDSE
jgi:hypothetical protein